jgi:hypothetical protein
MTIIWISLSRLTKKKPKPNVFWLKSQPCRLLCFVRSCTAIQSLWRNAGRVASSTVSPAREGIQVLCQYLESALTVCYFTHSSGWSLVRLLDSACWFFLVCFADYVFCRFTFHHCYGEEVTPIEIATELFDPLVESVVTGKNAALVLYGASGSGKSHSLDGAGSQPGALQYALKRIYQCMNSRVAWLESGRC